MEVSPCQMMVGEMMSSLLEAYPAVIQPPIPPSGGHLARIFKDLGVPAISFSIGILSVTLPSHTNVPLQWQQFREEKLRAAVAPLLPIPCLSRVSFGGI